MIISKKIVFASLLGFGALAVAGGLSATGADAADKSKVVTLTQVGCQFLESEAKNHMFMPKKGADCEAINEKTGKNRLATAPVIKLKPGKYVFRVTNKNVPYTLGFWIRSKGYSWKNPVHKLTKVSVSGGGLTTGKSRDYEVTLKPGEYVYSCPLNPTPNYRLLVEG